MPPGTFVQRTVCVFAACSPSSWMKLARKYRSFSIATRTPRLRGCGWTRTRTVTTDTGASAIMGDTDSSRLGRASTSGAGGKDTSRTPIRKASRASRVSFTARTSGAA